MLNQFRTANFILDILAVMLTALPIAYIASGGRWKKEYGRFFLEMCMCNIVLTAGDFFRRMAFPA